MILKRLKAETASEHAALARIIEQLGSFDSVSGYSRLLACFLGFYMPLERQIAVRPEWAAHHFDFERRMKSPALTHDLVALGHSPATLQALPQCAALPPAGEFTYTLGCAYVLEGATLGGQIVGRQIRTALGLTPGHGASFFASYGADVEPMWRAFCGLIAAIVVDIPAEELAIRGAHDTFQALGRWMVCGAIL